MSFFLLYVFIPLTENFLLLLEIIIIKVILLIIL